MQEEKNEPIEPGLFENGVKPNVQAFVVQKEVPAVVDEEGNEIEPAQTVKENVNTISGTDTKGNPVKYVLLSDKRIATVREGAGKDVGKATMEAGSDSSKYITSMMSACVSIEDRQVNMYDLDKLKMKDYIAIQVAFSVLNF